MKKVLIVGAFLVTSFLSAQDYSRALKDANMLKDIAVEQLSIEKDTDIRRILKSQIKQYDIMIKRFGGNTISNSSDFDKRFKSLELTGQEIADLEMDKFREYIKLWEAVKK